MLTITRPVLVKVRVTDGYKRKLATELQDAAARLELEVQQIEYQRHRLQEIAKKSPGNVETALAQLSEERQKRLDSRAKILDKLKEVARMVNNEEVIQGRVESIGQIEVGDDWQKFMNVEIILEDGKVAEIRTAKVDGSID